MTDHTSKDNEQPGARDRRIYRSDHRTPPARGIFAAGRTLLGRVTEPWPLANLVRNMLHEAIVGMDALDPQFAAALVRRDLDANEGFAACRPGWPA